MLTRVQSTHWLHNDTEQTCNAIIFCQENMYISESYEGMFLAVNTLFRIVINKVFLSPIVPESYKGF